MKNEIKRARKLQEIQMLKYLKKKKAVTFDSVMGSYKSNDRTVDGVETARGLTAKEEEKEDTDNFSDVDLESS
jgi:hypothetical protein